MRFSFLFVMAFLISCSNLPHVVKSDVVLNTSEKKSNKVYIVRHGWHTGIVVPSYQITSAVPKLKERFLDVPYLEFGWGDKGFYQTKKVTAKLALKAMLLPTESIIHVVGIQDAPELYFSQSEVVKLCLSQNQSAALVSFIAQSFLKKANQIVPTKEGIYGDSQFYQAQGSYYLLNTCNKWTAKGLASAGFDVSTAFKLSSNSVMRFLRKAKVLRLQSCE